MPDRAGPHGLHILHNRLGSAAFRGAGRQGLLRLRGVQDVRIPAVARQQNAQVALRLSVRINEPKRAILLALPISYISMMVVLLL